MSKALVLVVVLFFVAFCGECFGELRVGFYKGKCGRTDVEVVVKNVVETWHITKRETAIAAALLRMQFHDCFVNSGGKWYNVETGRKDGKVSLASNVNLPSPSISVSDSIKVFGNKNLSPTDMVYLLGGHTVGNTHCSLIQDRIYNFNNTGVHDPTMSQWLFSELKNKCPRVPSNTVDNPIPLDMKSPSFVDNSFFQEIQKGNGVLKIDQQLALDGLTKKIVGDIVKDPNFYTKFGEAMVKLGRVEVLTDGQGEVRTSCRVVNKKSFFFGLFNWNK
ncbi:hypothetical protein KY290_000396 [Solanum tuberosum]|uniref:peroxidase n=1 Tax=Solanum tuberosum TaxID=4113 RepID=A0ABQ7WJC1_SOLTU|nr:hypothetical protein KY290_000396 [Solanum tuberosum]